MEEPRAHVERIESAGVRTVTPVASGAMAWRAWGAGPPLVLLHGASGSWTHWIRNVLPLAGHHRVLAADMPGYGESDAPPDPHTADGLAGPVAAGIDRLVPPPALLHLAPLSLRPIIARAPVAGVWGARDAFTSPPLEESRRVLVAADPRFDMRVIDGAGHWVNYEAAEEVNALRSEMLARRTR